MSHGLVLTAEHGSVRVLTLNRPERRNALNRELIAALGDELDRATVSASVRAIVLTGSGTCFCAGMDLSRLAEGKEIDEAEAIDDANSIADIIDQIHTFPKPTIAALNGDALAGGAGLALACDFVIANETARIGYPEVLRGLVAAVVLHDLVSLAGLTLARRLLLTGEPITAREALDHGLIYQCLPLEHDLKVAIELAKSLGGGGPLAIATTKRLLNETSSRPKSLRGSAAISASVRVSEEAAEGIKAFFDKRPPHWAEPL